MQLTSIKSVAVAAGLVASLAAPSWALDAPDSFSDLVEEISPSVVSIMTSVSIPGGEQQLELPPNMPEFFRDLFENNPQFQQQMPREGRALGSGYIIDEEGYIVTNNHVVDNATTIMVETFDNQQLKAELVGRDVKTDVALLKVDSDVPLQATEFGDSDKVRVGDWVVAVGNPLGQSFSVSAGIVSARNRSLEGTYDDYIQTDAAINQGNSGGPLFDLDGKVVGMNTAILSPNGGSIGIGFAMSSRVVSKVVEQLKEYGSTRRGWLGVEIQPMTDDFAEAMGLDSAEGVLVRGVPDGPAKDGGIESGDVILEFDGKKVDDVGQLVRMVGDSEIGKTVDVEVFRQDEGNKTLKVTLGRLEDGSKLAANEDEPAPAEESQDTGELALGMTLQPLTVELASQYGIEQDGGLIVTEVEPDSVADTRAIQAGDVVRSANRQDVNSVDEMNSIIEQAKDEGRDSVLFVIERGGQANFVALPIQ